MSLSGLYNDNLYYQKDLDHDFVDMLMLFLKQLAPPICLISHNGNKYDFPLLKAELERLGRVLPAEILCVDSLEVLQAFDDCAIENGSSPIAKRTDLITDSNTKTVKTPDITAKGVQPVKKPAVFPGLPIPVMYNEQQIVNTTTPEIQLIPESWKKEPPPAPHPKKCYSRVAHVVDTATEEILSVRKRLFDQADEKNSPEKSSPPPSSETPMGPHGLKAMQSDKAFKVKKKLFDENDGSPLSTVSVPLELAKANIAAPNVEETPKKGSGSQETQLYWKTDSFESDKCVSIGADHSEKPEMIWHDSLPLSQSSCSDSQLLSAMEDLEEGCLDNPSDKQAMKETEKCENANLNNSGNSANNNSKRAAEPDTPQTTGPLPSTSKDFVASPSPAKRPRVSYKLQDIHKRVVGFEFSGAHGAEADCLAMVRIFQKTFRQVHPLLDEYAQPFESIEPLYKVNVGSKKPCLEPGQFPYMQ